MTGEELRALRKSMGLSQVRLGYDLGIPNPQVQISQYERGVVPISSRVKAAVLRLRENMELKRSLAQTRKAIGRTVA